MTGSTSAALRFVVLVGIVSFFADFTYEGGIPLFLLARSGYSRALLAVA